MSFDLKSGSCGFLVGDPFSLEPDPRPAGLGVEGSHRRSHSAGPRLLRAAEQNASYTGEREYRVGPHAGACPDDPTEPTAWASFWALPAPRGLPEGGAVHPATGSSH